MLRAARVLISVLFRAEHRNSRVESDLVDRRALDDSAAGLHLDDDRDRVVGGDGLGRIDEMVVEKCGPFDVVIVGKPDGGVRLASVPALPCFQVSRTSSRTSLARSPS
jgi:hypothetical protein